MRVRYILVCFLLRAFRFIADVTILCSVYPICWAYGFDPGFDDRLSAKDVDQIFPSSFSFLYSFKPFFRL